MVFPSKGGKALVYWIAALVLAIIFGGLSRSVTGGLATFAFTLLAMYFGMPTIAFGFWGVLWLLFFCGVVAAVAAGFGSSVRNNGDPDISRFAPGLGVAVVVLVVGIILVPIVTSGTMFHSDDYRALIGEIDRDGSEFASDTSPVDISQVRVVDQSLAHRKASKRLGQEAGLGSRAIVGEMNIQKVDGHLYWVGPLNHSSWTRWWSHPDGTPGYVMVSATNGDDIRLIQELDGNEIELKYNMGSFLGDYPVRHLYHNGYMSTGYSDFTFEVDDKGRPHWVVTTFEKKVGYAGEDATGVVVLDAQSGDMNWYSLTEAPDWIDRIQPNTFLVDQLKSWGWYVDGWFNYHWAKTNVITPTTGATPSGGSNANTAEAMVLVHGADGRAYWYSGMTSMGSDESTVGFVLIDSRTKEVRYYKQHGATETAAMRAAEGAVQEKNYYATTPIMYNVGGKPTYFITLKDKEGLVKRMAWVSVENYSTYGIGTNKKSSLSSYRNAMYSKGDEAAPTSGENRQKIIGVVDRIQSEVGGEQTVYYVMLKEPRNKLFSGTASLNPEIMVTQPGDTVRILFDAAGSRVVNMAGFDNREFDLQKTKQQLAVEEYAENVERRQRREQQVEDADAAFEDLSDEEKRKVLQEVRESDGQNSE